MVNDKINNGKQSTSSAGHFDDHADASEQCHVASLNVACPGLLRKPREATIGWLRTPYCLGGRQGDNRQTYNEKYTHFAGHFDGHRDAPVLYHAHCPMEEVQGFPKSP